MEFERENENDHDHVISSHVINVVCLIFHGSKIMIFGVLNLEFERLK